MSIEEHQAEHAKVGSWFLGPRAENIEDLKNLFSIVLDEQAEVRQNLYPRDPDFITKEMRDHEAHQTTIDGLEESVRTLSRRLAEHSVPFWSPRYHAHMTMETTMPSIVGYMAAMMYNQNNVATEASPVTTDLEKQVGDQLCRMLGYAGSNPPKGLPASWGHITCGGSVANLEAIWSTRNLKFYPFSLKWAIEEGKLGFLKNIQPAFEIETSKGEKKRFSDLSTWELLNLRPSTVLELPTCLNTEYSISPSFLQDSLKDYLVQSKGKEALEKKYNIKPGRFLIGATKHYSWPKGGAISGIGSDNFVDIEVDEEARMSIDDLRVHLDQCLKEEIPVFGVVAIIGSTEHGACDPVAEIVKIRTEYQRKGLSFAIHCDAAWGGYFTSTIREPPPGRGGKLPFVPPLALQPYTVMQLRSLQYADSITIDPHKSGYINYPAGGLCYRDERMRYLVTWTSPYIFSAGDESMGVYGVEGSKPGASAAAAWLTHSTLGLHKRGLGRLLGEAIFTSTKLYCHWATMTEPDDKNLIVVPLIRLPSEKMGLGSKAVEEERQRIRDKILKVNNIELYQDKETWDLLETLGGDLMINAFACNFKIDGKPNHDLCEANYLNERIYERTSIKSLQDRPEDCPIILMSSVFPRKAYQKCLDTLKRRLQLDDGSGNCRDARGDMRFLVNVTMTPWPTDPDFIGGLMKSFRQIANEEVERCVKRNTVTPDIHRFVMQGQDRIYLVHMPMFHLANRRWQLIMTAEYPDDVLKQYQQLRTENPDKIYTTANVRAAKLEDLLQNGEVEWRMDEGVTGAKDPLAKFTLKNLRIIVKESIRYAALDDDYPSHMPFYLYGSRGEIHMDHVLRSAPNAQISADCVKLVLDDDNNLTDGQLEKGVVAVLDNVLERSLQPLSPDGKNINIEAPGLGLTPEGTRKVTIYGEYVDFISGTATPIATGTVTFQQRLFSDWEKVNMDGALVELPGPQDANISP